MALNLSAKIEAIRKDLMNLKYTKKIEKDDLRLPEWLMLSEEYAKMQDEDGSARAVLSALNSIILQKRVVFCVTRKGLSALVKEDKNWKVREAFKSDHYARALKLLFEYCEKIPVDTMENPRGVLVMKVTHPDVLRYITANPEEQMTEVLDFLIKPMKVKGNQHRELHGEPAREPGWEPRSKEIEGSSQKAEGRSKKEEDRTQQPVGLGSVIQSKDSPGGQEWAAAVNVSPVGEVAVEGGANAAPLGAIQITRLGPHSARCQAVINAPGIVEKNHEMILRWEATGYKNGLKPEMHKVLEAMEEQLLLVNPTGGKLTPHDAHALLNDFIKEHHQLEEEAIRRQFAEKVGPIVSKTAFEEASKSWNIGPMLNHYRNWAKKQTAQMSRTN